MNQVQGVSYKVPRGTWHWDVDTLEGKLIALWVVQRASLRLVVAAIGNGCNQDILSAN